MAFLSTNAAARGMAQSLNLIEHGRWVEGYFEFGASPTVNVNDMIDFFDAGVFTSYYIGDWYVVCEQLDSNASPTLTVHVGFGDGSTGVSGTAGYRFATSRALGGPSIGSMLRNDSFMSHQQTAPNLRLGISIVTGAATAAFANKRLRFGVLPFALVHTK